MKKKDLIVIIVLLIIILIMGLFYNTKSDSYYTYVYYDNEVIDQIDLSVDGYYSYIGDYGDFNIEVVDGSYHACEVDCPNHICEDTGWVASGESTSIICLPNNIYVQQESSNIEDLD